MNSLALRSTYGRHTASAPRNGAVVRGGCSADTHERFKSVVLPHLSDARALARWLIRSSADAEDVVQDACVRAYRGIGTFADGNARAWVLTIVRHAAYSWLQKNRAVSLVSTDDLEAVESQHISERNLNTPETALMAQDDAMRLQASIDALPTSFREALVLRDVRGLTYRQIAEVTGVTMGTVMSRLARARGRVIADMRATGHDGFATATRSIVAGTFD
jgi:RNA polymerase sigma factor (sigma-70 family)